MNHKVLILGSTGLIGHQVYNYLKDNSSYLLSNISYRKKLQHDTIILDARNKQKLEDTIKNNNPNYIINCIGILIDGANNSPENAIFLNAYLPHFLLRVADEIGAKLIHMSTDCVFSGNKGVSYIEADVKDGKDNYAKTKGLGEIFSNRHLTLRTSVVGPELKGDGSELFHWFMNQSGSISGYTDVFWSGVTTIEIAKAVKWSIENNITGLYHITNNTSISKNDLLNLFKKYTKKDINIIPSGEKKIDKSFLDTRCLIDYEIPSYDQMIYEMVDLIVTNRLLYSQYEVEDFDIK